MPSLTVRSGFAVLVVSLALSGCGDPKGHIFDSETGKHVANWMPALHAAAASSGTTTLGNAIPSTDRCTECHGADLSGGISGVSCTSCHLGGPTAIHPASWVPIVLTHGPSVSSGTTPASKCANIYCHGPSLGGVPGSGPECNKCHSWPFDPASVVCGSCHTIPPSGSRYPNMAGRHAVHTAITGTSAPSCAACHNGSDGASGTVLHYNGAVEIAFLAAYNAKTGSASYNSGSLTCSQVSCHGGQTTPNWMSGSIDVNTQCGSCHVAGPSAGSPQYNSYYSGHHAFHLDPGVGAVCADCHDTTKLSAVHFNDLDTQAMTEAYLTIRASLNYTGTSGSMGNCTVNCHNEGHNNRPWL